MNKFATHYATNTKTPLTNTSYHGINTIFVEIRNLNIINKNWVTATVQFIGGAFIFYYESEFCCFFLAVLKHPD